MKNGIRYEKSLIGWLCLVFAFICGIAIIVPFAPGMPRLDLDGSWPFAVNTAVGRHLVFGRDLIFTAGPLSSIYTRQYSPATDGLMLVGAMFIALAVMMAIVRATSIERRPWLLLLPVALALYGMTDTIFLLIPWLLVVVAAHEPLNRRFNELWIHVLVGACALLPLIKGSGTLSAVLCMALVAAMLGKNRRIFLISIPATFVLVMALAWRLAGQGVRYLPGYFLSQSSIISGYGDAMSTEGPSFEVWLFLAAGVGVLASCAWLPRKVRLPVAAATALTLFISFKAGMIRHDAHATFPACAAVMIGVYLCFAIRHPGRYLALAVGVIPSMVIISDYVDVSPGALVANTQKLVVEQIGGAIERVSGSDHLKEQFSVAAQRIRASVPIAGEGVTADLYTSDVSAVILSDQWWTPRPTFQSYSAYTPDLVERNVAHLKSAAPERIYFRVDAIDHRYASLDDGASWPWLLGTYRPVGLVGEYLTLARTGEPKALPIGSPLISRTAKLFEAIALPTGQPLWATIELRPSFSGRLLGVLFKRPPVTLHVRFANGLEDSYRIIPGMTETGFLLAPTIRTSKDLLALWTGDKSAWVTGSVPVSMQLEVPPDARRWWKQEYRLTVSPFSIPAVPEPEPAFDRVDEAPASFELGGQCNIEKLNGMDIDGTTVTVSGRRATLVGWANIQANMGIAGDETALLVQDAHGKRQIVRAHKTQRGDVAAVFHHDSLVNSGYEATFDVSKMELPAQVSVLQTLGGSSVECRQRVVTLQRP